MSIFNKISVGVKTKKYTHHLPFDNNTTMQFGVIQPLFAQLLNASDRVSFDVKQLVRLAPLPVPTFGRMHLLNKVKFVNMTDVYPAYEAFLAHSYISTSHSSYIPTRLPFVSSQLLTLFLLRYSVYSTYVKQTDGTYKLSTKPSDYGSLYRDLQDVLVDDYQKLVTPQLALDTVSFDGADFIFESDDANVYCFRFTNAARRLRSLLIGLGYSFDLNNATDSLNFLPILSFYKAYYDSFCPQRESNWLSTACMRLINFIYDYNVTDVSNLYVDKSNDTNITDSVRQSALQFLDDLLNVWYVEPLNYVSAHRQDSGQNRAATVYNPQQLDASDDFENATIFGSDDGLPYTSSVNSIAVRQLLKLSRFMTKDSVLGQRVSSWLRTHFGANVDNNIFKDATNVADFIVNCNINDVFSTSDTLSSDGTGETLGAYAGKGLGFDNSHVEFTAPTFGYLFCLSCIVPDSQFFQGYDPTLYAVTPEQLPSADLDALGYEATPVASILPSNDICSLSTSVSMADETFGFVPRFSSFKTRKDIINGDMSRRGSINSFAPYYLDKILTRAYCASTLVSQDTYNLRFTLKSLPKASEAWRYTCKYPWLGNYNRIFTSGNYDSSSLVGDEDTTNYYTEQIIDDLFIVQSVFDMRLTNHLKPISESYDTYDDDVNGDNTSITQNAN